MQKKSRLSPVNTYRMAPNLRIVLLIFTIIFGYPVIYAIYDISIRSLTSSSPLHTAQTDDLCLRAFAMIFCLLCAALFFGKATTVRITTSPEGITYHDIGFRIHTSWDNVEKIGLIQSSWGKRIMWGGGVESLILRQSRKIQGSRLLARFSLIGQLGASISLSGFGHWRYGNLGTDIKRYAPHLLTPNN